MLKIVLNLLSLFVVPTIAALLCSVTYRIISWSASQPLDPAGLTTAIAVASLLAFMANTTRVLVSIFQSPEDD